MKLENYPIVKVLLPYVVGIMVAYFGDFSDEVCRIVAYVTGILFVASTLCSFVKAYKWRAITTTVMTTSFLFLGIFLTNKHFHSSLPKHLIEENTDWVVRVSEEPTPREKSVKVVAEVLQTSENQKIISKILLYLQPSDEAHELRYGDLLFVHTNLSRIEPPHNPDAFDNQQYMRRRGIYYSGFVHDGAWQCFGHAPANRLKFIAQKIRNQLTNTYITAGMSGDELDILKAILLGADDTLDPELKASYSSAGVSHILCVSGMHVGVIFMIINFLLKPLDLFRSSKIFKSVLVMLVIWLYAHITGLAPSVTRSATMFSFVAVGQLLRRNTNVFHSLFASMFILLVINPLLLFEVGFQLSYFAVAGIVLFQPKLSALYQCRTKIGNYFWELLTVSVAAQLGTSPISIYYFAQFPNYFMLSNLSVITLSFVVIITGVALLPVSLFPFLAHYLSTLLTLEIRLMNKIITFIESLPGSVTENLDNRLPQVLLLYGVIMFVCLWLYQKYRKFFWGASICLTMFCISFPVKKWMLCRETDYIAYHIRKSSAVEFNYHGQAIVFADSIRHAEDKLFQYNIRNHARRHHLQTEIVNLDTAQFDCPFLCKRGNFIRFGNKNIFILTQKQKIWKGDFVSGLRIDCLFLRQNPRMDPEELLAIIPFQEVLADGSNTPFYIDRWRVFCEAKNIPFTYTGDRKMTNGR
jgi:competence protein ComEC